MSDQDQTILAGDGQVGDCFRACIATIIGKRTEGVPHFALLGDLHWMETAVAWLNAQGYETDIRPAASDGLELLPLHIVQGMSPRGVLHAVVGETATGEVAHDPHPSRAGLSAVHGRIYLFKRATQPPAERAPSSVQDGQGGLTFEQYWDSLPCDPDADASVVASCRYAAENAWNRAILAHQTAPTVDNVPEGGRAKLACDAKEAVFGLSNLLRQATTDSAWCAEVERPHLDKAFRTIDALAAPKEQAAEREAVPRQILDALERAMAICDAVPSQLHLSTDSALARVGRLVNVQDGEGHGYALIRDALEQARGSNEPPAAQEGKTGPDALHWKRRALESEEKLAMGIRNPELYVSPGIPLSHELMRLNEYDKAHISSTVAQQTSAQVDAPEGGA